MRSAILQYIDQNEAVMLALWRDLVKIESPSHYKAGVDGVGELIAKYCTNALGYHIRYQQDEKYGNCLAACSCPFEQFRDGIVISAHMDTVHAIGSFDPVLREDDDYLYGPGAGDCKGGIVMALLTASALKFAGYNSRPIKLIFAADEESGGPTGRTFYPNELAGAAYMFNAESGIRDKLVTGRKSSLIARFTISGTPAHIGYLAGTPQSAIREAALKLLALEDSSNYDTLTFCAGTIHGGTVATSVPGGCVLEVNVRIKDEKYVSKAFSILENIANQTFVQGTSCQLEVLGNTVPMSQKEENIALCDRFSTISQQLGFGKYEAVFVGGASDASYASQMGVPVVCASGPIVDFQHTLNERVLKASMAERAKVHACLILEL